MRFIIGTEFGDVDAEIIKVEGYTLFYKPSLQSEKWLDMTITHVKSIRVRDTHGHPGF